MTSFPLAPRRSLVCPRAGPSSAAPALADAAVDGLVRSTNAEPSSTSFGLGGGGDEPASNSPKSHVMRHRSVGDGRGRVRPARHATRRRESPVIAGRGCISGESRSLMTHLVRRRRERGDRTCCRTAAPAEDSRQCPGQCSRHRTVVQDRRGSARRGFRPGAGRPACARPRRAPPASGWQARACPGCC